MTSMFMYRPSSTPSLNTRAWFTRGASRPAWRMTHMRQAIAHRRFGAVERFEVQAAQPAEAALLVGQVEAHHELRLLLAWSQSNMLPLRRQAAAGKLSPVEAQARS